MILKENEVIDELNICDLKIIQNNEGFKYGTDAVALSRFAGIKKDAKVLDLCTGSGIIPILLTAFKNPKTVTAIEYFPEIADMAKRSVSLNNLEDKINIICSDVKNIKESVREHSFDNVTVNPPYKTVNTGLINENYFKKVARHEILLSLSECVFACAYSVKFGGKVTMVNRVDRLSDVFYEFKKNKIEPKRLAFVGKDLKTKPKIFLIEGIYGGKSGMVVEPLIVM